MHEGRAILVPIALWIGACHAGQGGKEAQTADADTAHGDAALLDGGKGEDGGGASGPDAQADDASGAAGDAASPGADGGAVASCVLRDSVGAPSSPWAAVSADGASLAYGTLPTGERLLDFSYAGYMGGGVALPKASVARTLNPSGGDDTAAIQAALDAIATLPLDQGLRGAVLLGPGTFKVTAPLTITASGVVLRGSGSGKNGTTLQVGGNPHVAIDVHGTGAWKATGKAAQITDGYVPAGARSFAVDDATAFKAGDHVLVDRPVTDPWIHFMGMDALVRNGQPQTWLSNTTVIHSDRIVTAVAGNTLTVDAPLSDSLDKKYVSPPGASVTHYTFAGRIEQVGVEALHLVAPKQTVPITDPTYTAITMDAVQNAWVHDVSTEEFTTGIVLNDGAKWVTIEDSSIARTAPVDNSAGYPFQISVAGQQTLVQRCSTSGDDGFAYATQARTPGPNVVLGLRATGSNDPIDPHQRWATGLLVDSCKVSEIDLMNRGFFGSGHGWTIGFGVVWNSQADTFLIQQPPGAQNWAIGSTGKIDKQPAPGSTDKTPLPTGIIDSEGVPVAPKSLYLAQLCLRLGPGALKNIGY